MLDQVGPHKLWEELRDQGPRYAKILPELPRLLHGYLAGHQGHMQGDMRELLQEMRRTNRLLQGIIYAGIGFALGLVVVQMMVRVALF